MFGVKLIVFFTSLLGLIYCQSHGEAATSDGNGSYKIEGKILIPPGDNSLDNTRVLIDEGQYIGIPQVDGTFVVYGISSGSYIVSVVSPLHVFEPVRVDITAKGKIRARKVNFIQPAEVVTMKYPLNFETHGIPNYFQKREVYRVTDVIMNPMFLTLLVPLLLLLILPKLASQDPEMQRDMQQATNFLQPTNSLPDLGDMVNNMMSKFGGGPKKTKPREQQRIEGSSANGGGASASGGSPNSSPTTPTSTTQKRKPDSSKRKS